jgi:lysozyme
MNNANKWLAGAAASAALLAGVAQWEGTRYVPYEDVVGVWTVCQGYAQPDVVRGRTYTPAECRDMTEKQLAAHGAAVLRCVNVPLARYEYDAYVLFAYNVGGAAFCGSSLLKRLNQGDHVGACNGLLAWNMAGGKRVQGLANRREYERRMCLGLLK